MAVDSSSFFHSSYNCLSRSVVFDCEYPFSRLLLSLSYIVHLTISMKLLDEAENDRYLENYFISRGPAEAD